MIEECGEFLAAAGKTQRWGINSVNPELPPDETEPNIQWLFRELHDVLEAGARLEATMNSMMSREPAA